jgi:hypothetical protein
MFLHAVGEKNRARQALLSAEIYESRDQGVLGHKPYVDLLIYENRMINAIFYPDKPKKTWDDIDFVWPEGSLGVAMAHLKLGEESKAKKIIEQIASLQDSDGGIPYATSDIRFQFSTNPSVAGTAWFVMAVAALENPDVQALFWSE